MGMLHLFDRNFSIFFGKKNTSVETWYAVDSVSLIEIYSWTAQPHQHHTFEFQYQILGLKQLAPTPPVNANDKTLSKYNTYNMLEILLECSIV